MCTDLWKSISFGPAVRKNSPTARHSSPRNISSNVCTLLYLSLHKLIDLACIRGGEDLSLSGRWGLIFFECEWLSGLVIAVLRAINEQGLLNWNYLTFVNILPKKKKKNPKLKADNSVLTCNFNIALFALNPSYAIQSYIGVVCKTLAPENSTKILLHVRSLHVDKGGQDFCARFLVHNVFHVGGFHKLSGTAKINADGIDGFTFDCCWLVPNNVVAIIWFLDKLRGVILEATFPKEWRIREKIYK